MLRLTHLIYTTSPVYKESEAVEDRKQSQERDIVSMDKVHAQDGKTTLVKEDREILSKWNTVKATDVREIENIIRHIKEGRGRKSVENQ